MIFISIFFKTAGHGSKADLNASIIASEYFIELSLISSDMF